MTRLIFALLIVSLNAYSQVIPVIRFRELEEVINKTDHEVKVINFWATWCGPCVNELPIFGNIDEDEAEVLLVNLDFADKIERVRSFVKRKGISQKVVLLDEIDYNSWIDRIDKTWSGAIPATLFINTKTGKRVFVGKELDKAELQRILVEIKH